MHCMIAASREMSDEPKLGNSYHSLAQYTQAEAAYMKASRMLPNRLYPHYCLFMLYKETDQKEKAYDQATQIQQLSPKKDNEYARELKSFIHGYLQNKTHDSFDGK